MGFVEFVQSHGFSGRLYLVTVWCIFIQKVQSRPSETASQGELQCGIVGTFWIFTSREHSWFAFVLIIINKVNCEEQTAVTTDFISPSSSCGYAMYNICRHISLSILMTKACFDFIHNFFSKSSEEFAYCDHTFDWFVLGINHYPLIKCSGNNLEWIHHRKQVSSVVINSFFSCLRNVSCASCILFLFFFPFFY